MRVLGNKLNIVLKTKVYDCGLYCLAEKVLLWTEHSLWKAHDYQRSPENFERLWAQVFVSGLRAGWVWSLGDMEWVFIQWLNECGDYSDSKI